MVKKKEENTFCAWKNGFLIRDNHALIQDFLWATDFEINSSTCCNADFFPNAWQHLISEQRTQNSAFKYVTQGILRHIEFLEILKLIINSLNVRRMHPLFVSLYYSDSHHSWYIVCLGVYIYYVVIQMNIQSVTHWEINANHLEYVKSWPELWSGEGKPSRTCALGTRSIET